MSVDSLLSNFGVHGLLQHCTSHLCPGTTCRASRGQKTIFIRTRAAIHHG